MIVKINLPRPSHWTDKDAKHGTPPFIALTTNPGSQDITLEMFNGEEAIDAVVDLETMTEIARAFRNFQDNCVVELVLDKRHTP